MLGVRIQTPGTVQSIGDTATKDKLNAFIELTL